MLAVPPSFYYFHFLTSPTTTYSYQFTISYIFIIFIFWFSESQQFIKWLYRNNWRKLYLVCSIISFRIFRPPIPASLFTTTTINVLSLSADHYKMKTMLCYNNIVIQFIQNMMSSPLPSGSAVLHSYQNIVFHNSQSFCFFSAYFVFDFLCIPLWPYMLHCYYLFFQ